MQKTLSDYGIEITNQPSARGEVKVKCPQCQHQRHKHPSDRPLSVNLDKGVWKCHHCGWSGPPTGESFAEAESGARTHRPAPPKPVVYEKPDPGSVSSQLSEKAITYFERRCITRKVLLRNKVFTTKRYHGASQKQQQHIAFPMYRDNELVNIKYRGPQKSFQLQGGCELIWMGLDDIDPECVIIVEGEIDKLSFEVAGYTSVISVPNGAPDKNAKKINHHLRFVGDERLDNVKRFILAGDNDEVGRRLMDEISRRLGPERCMRVAWPEDCKDCNDVLRTHGARRIKEAIDAAEYVPIENVAQPGEDALSRKIIDVFLNGSAPGVSTGYQTLDRFFTVKEGQLTIVTGIPTHGKSTFVEDMAVNIARENDYFVGAFSPESYPLERFSGQLIGRYIRKSFDSAGPQGMALNEMKQGLAWLHEHFGYIDFENTDTLTTLGEVLGAAERLLRRHGLQVLVIDPWNELVQEDDRIPETEWVKRSLGTIRAWARKHRVHVILVAHPQKMRKDAEGNYPVPTPYDISGSAHFYNRADNCITVYRPADAQPENKTQIHIQKVKFKECGKPGVCDIFYNWVYDGYVDAKNLSTIPPQVGGDRAEAATYDDDALPDSGLDDEFGMESGDIGDMNFNFGQ